jgi:glycosyltransferase involved in cell wall biosynthesis
VICFVCSNLWPYTFGGAERRYYEFAVELLRRGYEVRYITYSWGPSEVPLAPVGPPPQLYDGAGRRRLWPALQFALAVRGAVARAGCRVVDASVPYTEVFLLPRERTILTLHEFWGRRWREYFGPPVGRAVEWAERRMVLRPRAVVVPSGLTAERVRRVRRDVYAIPFGLRLEDYMKYRGAGKEFDVVIVSRLVPYKGVREALAALRLAERRLRVAVVGNGPLLEEARREAERGRHLFRLYPSASEEEKRRIVASSVYYLNMSSAEGFSIATLEAVALGAYPVVLRSGHNAAVELVEALGYGAVVTTPEEAAAVISTDCVPEPPTAPLWQYHIAKVVDRYEQVIKAIYI